MGLSGVAQSKEELILKIKELNILESDDKGLPIEYPEGYIVPAAVIPSNTDNYANFEALSEILSRAELRELARDKNAVLRMFAIRKLFLLKDTVFNFSKAFIDELSSPTYIKNHEGCEIYPSLTSAVIFYDQSRNWNATSYLNKKRDFEFVNAILNKIDLYCLYYHKKLQNHYYETIFERRKFPIEHLKRIKELAYSQTNYYAFEYIKKQHPNDFRLIKDSIIQDITNNSRLSLKERPRQFYEFLKYSIQSENDSLRNLLLKQFKQKGNNENEYSWIKNRIRIETNFEIE